jgi:hypothetical protein
MTELEPRGRYVVGFVIAVIVGIIFALAALGGVIGAASTSSYRAHNHTTFGGDIALAVISGVIVIVCILVGAHFEHRLRRHNPAAQSWGVNAGAMSGSMPRIGRKRYSPLTASIYFVVLTAMPIGLAIGAVFVHADADRSALVQHHGIARTGTVLRLDNHYHSSRGGGYYTADVYMSFIPPIDGRTQTVAHYPGRVDDPAGIRLQILVDPKDPGYAEFPGSPSTRSSAWILLIVFAVALACVDVFVGRAFVRLWRHRRAFSNAGLSEGPSST